LTPHPRRSASGGRAVRNGGAKCPHGDSTLSLELVDAVARSATTVFFECEDLDAA
jgi:hypothetical protein